MVFYAGMNIEGAAELQGFFGEAKKKVKAATKSAVTSGAFYFRDQVKIGAAEGLPGWKPLSPVTPTMAAYPADPNYTMGLTAKRQAAKVHASDAYKQQRKAAKKAGLATGLMNQTAREAKSFLKKDFKKTVGKGFLGKLQNIFRYKVTETDDAYYAVVGVLPDQVGPKGLRYFREFQEGGDAGPDRAVFRTMQRYFYGLGFSKSSKPMFNTPRPLINPVFDRQREAIMGTMQAKFDRKMGVE
jgi:hypothetical protein